MSEPQALSGSMQGLGTLHLAPAGCPLVQGRRGVHWAEDTAHLGLLTLVDFFGHIPLLMLQGLCYKTPQPCLYLSHFGSQVMLRPGPFPGSWFGGSLGMSEVSQILLQAGSLLLECEQLEDSKAGALPWIWNVEFPEFLLDCLSLLATSSSRCSQVRADLFVKESLFAVQHLITSRWQ